MRGQPLLSQVFLEIGETERLKLFALSAGDVVRTGAAHERCATLSKTTDVGVEKERTPGRDGPNFLQVSLPR